MTVPIWKLTNFDLFVLTISSNNIFLFFSFYTSCGLIKVRTLFFFLLLTNKKFLAHPNPSSRVRVYNIRMLPGWWLHHKYWRRHPYTYTIFIRIQLVYPLWWRHHYDIQRNSRAPNFGLILSHKAYSCQKNLLKIINLTLDALYYPVALLEIRTWLPLFILKYLGNNFFDNLSSAKRN